MNVGIRELKQHLSAYVARARAGETVIITDHGKPVARLEPIQRDEPPAALRPLIDAGLILYKGPLLRDLPPPIAMLPGEKTMTDYVSEQRR